MKNVGLILWILLGYLVAMAVYELNPADPALAVLCGCLATSVSQRIYTMTGRWK
jgi:hypothetical protein